MSTHAEGAGPIAIEIPAHTRQVDPRELVAAVLHIVNTAPTAMSACSAIKSEVDRWQFGTAPVPR